MPLVTVIIPAHNAAATIAEALSSVAGQMGLKRVIVIDDGSVDATADVARRAWSGYSVPLEVVRHDVARGPAVARNAGIAMVDAEWIAFLDADDAWMPGKLATQLQLAGKFPDVALWCSDRATMGEDAADDENASAVGAPGHHPLDIADLIFLNPIATSTVMVRAEAVRGVGGFDEQFRGPEDYDLWIRILARHKAAFIEQALIRYRHTPGSLSLDDQKFLPQVLRVIDKAFGKGGALAGRKGRRKARAYQYLCASWAAGQRKERRRATSLFFTSLATWPFSFKPEGNLPWARLKLLKRLASW